MFARDRVDNAPELGAVPVEISFVDGTAKKGKLLVPVPKTVADALNGSTAFRIRALWRGQALPG